MLTTVALLDIRLTEGAQPSIQPDSVCGRFGACLLTHWLLSVRGFVEIVVFLRFKESINAKPVHKFNIDYYPNISSHLIILNFWFSWLWDPCIRRSFGQQRYQTLYVHNNFTLVQYPLASKLYTPPHVVPVGFIFFTYMPIDRNTTTIQLEY